MVSEKLDVNLCSSIGKVFFSFGSRIYIFKRFYLFVFRGKGREKKREVNINVREKHQLCFLYMT